jgi:hypothetical protein
MMDLARVMDDIADRLDTIEGLRVHNMPVGKVTPPAAVVSYPDSYDFDATYARGMDRLSVPVVLVVGRPSDTATREALGQYCDGSGPRSVKGVLESWSYTAFDEIRVVRIDFDVVTIATVDYMAAVFTNDVTGTGS